jgi:hypothetical protein
VANSLSLLAPAAQAEQSGVEKNLLLLIQPCFQLAQWKFVLCIIAWWVDRRHNALTIRE